MIKVLYNKTPGPDLSIPAMVFLQPRHSRSGSRNDLTAFIS
jgi:hypothetical protein